MQQGGRLMEVDRSRRSRVIRRGIQCLGSSMLVAVTATAQAVTYNSATISFLQSPTPNAACMLFTLPGVTTADPIVPGQAWIGVPNTQIGYQEIVAILISAKLSGSPMQVTTTGALAGGTCGSVPGIDHVTLD